MPSAFSCGEKKMRPKRIIASILVTFALATGPFGCAQIPRVPRFAVIPDSHLIFNPEWTNAPFGTIARADWPIAHVYDSSNETVRYRTTTIDRQTQSGSRGARDQFTRTFRSIRRGSARR